MKKEKPDPQENAATVNGDPLAAAPVDAGASRGTSGARRAGRARIGNACCAPPPILKISRKRAARERTEAAQYANVALLQKLIAGARQF
jgi:hypothetical protein